MRAPLSLVLGAAVAAGGALVLGEYELRGLTGVAAGVVFGLVVGEVVSSVSRRRGLLWISVCAVLTGAGLGWAARISTGYGVAPMPSSAWVAISSGVAAAAVRASRPGTRATGSRPAP